MAEILWIGNGSNTAWHTPTNWQGGVVPDINDTAVFTNTGTGNCTLANNATIGGLKVFGNYAGDFRFNGNSLTVSNDVLLQATVTDTPIINAAGTADQEFDIGDNTVDFAAYKNAGLLLIRSGDYKLVEDSYCGEWICHSPHFDPNGKTFTVGNHGVGRYYQIANYQVTTPYNGTIRLDCDDVYIANASTSMNTRFVYEIYGSQCVLKQKTVTGIRKLIVKSGGRLCYQPGTHPFDVSMTSYSALRSNGYGITIEQGGVLDVTYANVQCQDSAGEAEFVNNGEVVNTGLALRTVTLDQQNAIHAGIMTGNIHLIMGLQSNNAPVSGDLRDIAHVEIKQTTSRSGVVIDGEILLPDTRLTTCGPNNPVTGTITCYGNLNVAENWDLSGLQITPAGDGDQTLDIGLSTVGLVVNKLAGKVIFQGGNFILNDHSYFPDNLFFTETYTGVFRQNGKTMTIASKNLHMTETDLEKWEMSGSIVFVGDDFVLKNAVLPDDCHLIFSPSSTVSSCKQEFL